jgi:DNA-binding response OmpR family regulator
MKKKKILLVDDERDIITLITPRLIASGYDVITALDGEEALDKAKKEKPDLIILDIMLPKINGYQICDTLKSDLKYKNIPIILFTAKAQDDDIKSGKKVGADAYVTKPFDSTMLMGQIKKFLTK